jgi:hypothetical protein
MDGDMQVASDMDPPLIGAPAAVAWSSAQVTMTHSRRLGEPEIIRVFELLEHVIQICIPDRSLKILIEEQIVMDKWNEMITAARSDFTGVSSEE